MSNKLKGLLITLAVYSLSLSCAVLMASKFTFLNEWLMILIAHLTATIVVFAASRFYKNSSLYDPFWSVAPAPIVFYLAFWPESQEINLEKIALIIVPILLWSFRLTINWMRSWKGLQDEDFRYINLKEKPFSGLIDLFGIHVYPTLQVNLSLLPAYYALSVSVTNVTPLLYLASIFTILAVVLETLADEQMHAFKKDSNNNDQTMDKGLWSYSRHPNYLGEILFWWGIYFMTISLDINYWPLFICPLIMNLMFSLITCSMMDERSILKRPDYQDYMSKTRQLILWPSKR